MNGKTLSFCVAALIAVAGFAVERIDGVCQTSDAYLSRSWSDNHTWIGAAYARGGGRASFAKDGWWTTSSAFANYSESYYNQNLSSLSLMGIDFKLLNISLNGNQINMVGPCPYIAATTHAVSVGTSGADQRIYWPRVNVVLNGEGTNVLVKQGTGPIFINKSPTNFAAVDVVDGTLVLTNTAVAVSSADQPLVIKTGKVLVTPPADGTLTLANVQSKLGAGTLAITNAATVSLTSLTRGDAGVLNFETSNGGKIVNPGRDAGTAVDPGLVFVTNGVIRFADYDAEKGFVAGESTPATAQIIGSPDTASGTTTSAGAIDKSYVYLQASSKGNTTVKLDGALSAATTVASFQNNGMRVSASISSLPETTCDLKFVGGLTVNETSTTDTTAGKIFPVGSGATVTLCGSATTASSPHMTFYYKYPREANCNFRVAGGSESESGSALWFKGIDWTASYFSFKGSIELLDDTSFYFNNNGNNDSGNIKMEGPVVGRGGLTKLGSGNLGLFSSANSFAGTLKISGGAVYTSGSGKFGDGDINITSASGELCISDAPQARDLKNYFTGSNGDFVLQNSIATFNHPVTLDRLSLQDKANRTPTLTINADLTAKFAINDLDCVIQAGTNDVTFTTGGGKWSSVLRGDLRDGSGENGGKLAFVKSGSNLAVLAGTNNTYSGKTLVKEGTLKLGPGEYNGNFSKDDVSFWLDGSDTNTMTIARVSGTNTITKWRSKVGSAALSAYSWQAAANRPEMVKLEDDDPYFNGHSFVRLTYGMKQYLFTDTALPIRTIFIMCRQRDGTSHTQGSLLNYAGNDCSLRINQYGYLSFKRDGSDNWINGRTAQGYYNGILSYYAYLKSAADTGAIGVTFYNQRQYFGNGSYNHRPEFALRFGSVGRDWHGDVGEIVIFNRYLSQGEVFAVENYLFNKWNPTERSQHAAATCHVERRVNYIPSASELEIVKGAILDLNGSDQTVAALSGDGIVTNSSATAAKLTVTGANTFKGTVTGNVRFTVPSGDREICIRNGATLVLTGDGATKLTPGNVAPPTDSVIVWVDASQSETVMRDANNKVTFWTNCNNGVSCSCIGFKPDNDYKPAYSEIGWTNTAGTVVKPAINFATAYRRLVLYSNPNSSANVKCGTLFLVMRADSTDINYTFNFSSSDSGLAVTSDRVWTGGQQCKLAHSGDTVHVNGKQVSLTDDYYVSGPLVYAFRPGDAHYNNLASHLTGAWALGNYSGNRSTKVRIAEVIGYSRRLTDAEFVATERYLMNKWIAAETQNTSVFDSSSALVANGASVDLGSEALSLAGFGSGTYTSTGGFTVRDGITLDVANGQIVPAVFNGDVTFGNGTDAIPLTVNSYSQMQSTYWRQPAVTVSGTATGSLATDETEHTKWSFKAGEKAWTFLRKGMVILLW